MDEEIKDQEVKKTNKELSNERMMARYPDMDEETMYGEHLKYMDDMDRASESHKSLNDKLTQHPKAAMMIGDMMDGKHPKVAMKRYFADEEDVDDETLSEELLNAERERIAEEQESEGMRAEYEANLAASAEDVKAFKEGKGIDDEKFGEFMESAIDIVGDLLSGKLNMQLLEILWKGRNYDTDLANESSMAEERGRISERNTKIETQKKRMQGDGMPFTPTSSVKGNSVNVPFRKSAWDQNK